MPRVSDEELEKYASYVEAGPNWTPSEIDGCVEPQACLSRRQAENMIEDLRDAKERIEVLEAAAKDAHSWLVNLQDEDYTENTPSLEEIIRILWNALNDEEEENEGK